jgi:hypothetical protein
MPLYICPKDGETFAEKPAGGRCPIHKVLVKEVDEESSPHSQTPGAAAGAVPSAQVKRPTGRK